MHELKNVFRLLDDVFTQQKVSVIEDESFVKTEIPLPGVKKNQVFLELDEKKREISLDLDDEGKKTYLKYSGMKFYPGVYKLMDSTLQLDKIKTSLDLGILTIDIPRGKEVSKTKKISIN